MTSSRVLNMIKLILKRGYKTTSIRRQNIALVIIVSILFALFIFTISSKISICDRAGYCMEQDLSL